MAGQIYRNVIEVPRKVQRLAWLTSQAPAYAESLAWWHKPPPPPDPLPHPDQRGLQGRAWSYSSQPSYAESVVWRHPQPQPPEPPPLPDQRGRQLLAWSFSPMPGYAETLAWWHKPPAPPDVPVEVRLTNGASAPPWPAGIAPISVNAPLPWLRVVKVPSPPPDLFIEPLRSRVPLWAGGSSGSLDRLPWRRRASPYVDTAFALLGLSSAPPRLPGWTPVIPPHPPGPPSHAGINKPFVDRVPNAEPRLRRHTEKVADILNSFMRQGIIYSTAPGVWAIDTTITPGNGPTGTFEDTFP